MMSKKHLNDCSNVPDSSYPFFNGLIRLCVLKFFKLSSQIAIFASQFDQYGLSMVGNAKLVNQMKVTCDRYVQFRRWG